MVQGFIMADVNGKNKFIPANKKNVEFIKEINSYLQRDDIWNPNLLEKGKPVFFDLVEKKIREVFKSGFVTISLKLTPKSTTMVRTFDSAFNKLDPYYNFATVFDLDAFIINVKNGKQIKFSWEVTKVLKHNK